MTLYEKLVAAGVPVDNHASDLYVRATPVAAVLLADYEHLANVQVFRSQVDGEWWWDVPFAYDPFWARVPQA